MTIKLFEESREEISISIIAEITSNGDLSLRGIDSGKQVKQLKDSWDYEYNLIVKKTDKEILIRRLGSENPSINNDAAFMEWLKLNFSHNQAFSEFLSLLGKMNIIKDTFFWP